MSSDDDYKRAEESTPLLSTLSLIPSVSLNILLQVLLWIVPVLFVAKVGDTSLLAGVGLGIALVNMVALAPMLGINAGVETIIAQSFGARMYDAGGVALNQGRFLATLILIPGVIVLCFSQKILVAFNQDAAVAEIAQTFCLTLLPGIWAFSLADVDRRARSAMLAGGLTTMGPVVIALALHFLWCWLFISKMDKREVGVAIALDITFFIILILQQVLMFVDHCELNVLPNGRMFDVSGLLNLIKIGAPSLLSMISEMWWWQGLTLAAGSISVPALVAFVAYTNIYLFDIVPIAFGFCASAWVGMNIGMAKTGSAMKIAGFYIFMTCLFSGLFILILDLCKEQVAGMFTSDEATQEVILSTTTPLFIFLFLSALSTVQQGIMRAKGQQMVALICSIICQWLVGLPTALVLAFKKDMGLEGLLLGYSGALILLNLAYVVAIWCLQWADSPKVEQQLQEPLTPEMPRLRRLSTP